MGLLIATLCLSGCVTQELIPTEAGDTRLQWLAGQDRWNFNGRIGVKSADDGFNGNIRWRQNGPVYSATLSGPLGAGSIFVNGNGNQASLTDKDGNFTELEDVEGQLRYRYGWTVPVDSLRYWALGIAAPDSEAQIEQGPEGLPSVIRQNDWQVSFDRYRTVSEHALPTRLTATHKDVRVRLVIDRWNFP